MSTFLKRFAVCLAWVSMPLLAMAQDYQLPDPHFEDWSGAAFDGKIQPKYWHGSNVSQVGFNFNFTTRETGRTGYAVKVEDKEVGAMGITEVGPGYFSLGNAWQYLSGLNTGSATAGTVGGINFSHRPDSVSVWIKRTGNNTDKEDFHILFYSWTGTAKGTSYKAKSGGCSSTTQTDEESDIRIALDGNECKTETAGTQIAEGWLHTRAQYNDWTNIRIPIYYMSDDAPAKCNMLFSASNYPNYRANSGLYSGNAIIVDDVELIYSSKIQTLRVGGKEWKGFDPNNTGVQTYSVPEGTTAVPSIEAYRGAGSLTNVAGQSTTKTVNFDGRKLSGSEITITPGTVGGTPTTIVVRAEDGSSTTTYQILFQAEASSNAKLAEITYSYTDINNQVVTASVPGFNPGTYNYNVELPYGAKGTPTIAASKQEDEQNLAFTQSSSLTGRASVAVTAANGTAKATYNVNFSEGLLADNTLKDITVDGVSIPGFTPSQAVYKVSLPVGTTQMPAIVGVSAYPEGEQTITYNAPAVIDGGSYTISVSTPGNTVPKVYKLNFKLEASSYSYLKSLKVGGADVTNFDPTQMTYYVHLPLGTAALPEITYEAGDNFQTIEKTDLPAGAVDGTVRITVTAGNGDQSVYKVVFSTEKSDRSTLSGIKIGGVDIEGFSPDNVSYSHKLPTGTTELPEIEAVPGDEYQTIVLTTAGLNGKTRITVTAGDGSVTIYQIAFSVDAYTDNTLSALSVAGYSLQNAEGTEVTFEAEVNEYWINLPQGTTGILPAVSYTLQSETMQSASTRSFSGLNGDYKITVRPQSGSSRTYIIHFSVATSSNTNLNMIYIGGVEIPDFRPDSLNYRDSLPVGSSVIPAVTYKKAEESQRVLSVVEGKTQKITVTAESGAKKTYTINFISRASANAYLEWIELDGVRMGTFVPKTLDYEVELKGDRCPEITVGKAAGQQVTVTAPYSTGDAKIVVKPEDGEANTYTISFVSPTAASALLANIILDGSVISDFKSDSMDYKAEYTNTIPAITYTKQDASQDVQILWKDSVAWLNVRDTVGNQAAYSITFHRNYSSDASLKAIYANGTLIETPFDPAKRIYSKNLPAGSAYPEITYEPKSENQIVFFGQTGAGQWKITVQAENGDTAQYAINYTINKYNDATLKNMTVAGKTLTPAFDSNTFEYTVTIDEGALLPVLSVETRKGQTVLQSDVDDTHQQVIVNAESGATHTYNITYTRTPSSNALLADILLDGVSLEGFNPTDTNYVDSLEWRTKVIPNVFPVAQQDNQTITTYYSRPNGVTKIHVEAQDGTTKDYFIAFPVRKSSYNKLGALTLGSAELDLAPAFNPDVLDYVVEMPVGATECPTIDFEKGKENSKEISEQRIDLISRPVGDTTKIIVTAENGDQRIYKIHFKETYPTEANYLSAIRITFDNDPETEIEFKKPKVNRDTVLAVPFGTRRLDVTYEKMYPEQTVFVQPGGVHHPTIITVKSNRPGEADEVYTITPNMPTADPAVLTDIRINGVSLTDFESEKFSYIVNVTSKPIIRYTVNKGAEINIVEQTSKHWQAEVTYGSRTNIYDVWYYYINDSVPNPDFTEWSTMRVDQTGEKPTGWNALGDTLNKYSSWAMNFYPAELVRHEDDKVHLITLYSRPNGGIIPAFITLGNPHGSWGEWGSNSLDITGGVSFHNSPDKMLLTYYVKSLYEKDEAPHTNQIQYILTGDEGVKTLEWNDASTMSGYETREFDLSEANAVAGNPILLNIVLNSAPQTGGFNGFGYVSAVKNNPVAETYFDRIAFTYNHTLTSLMVDTFPATKEGSAFTATLTDPERIEKPILTFTGEVKDQSPLVTWSAEVVNGDYGVRNATIRNFAENGVDYTKYTLAVRRPLDKRNQLADLKLNGTTITGFAADKLNYEVTMAYKQLLPDVMPVAASSLQTITTAFNAADSTMTITVKPEKGENTVYTVKFTFPRSNDATLNMISANGLTPAFDAATKDYEITAENWPIVTFVKKSDLQTVELINGVLTVTAENGATGTYTITRKDPKPVTTANLKDFYLGTNPLSDLGNDNLTKVAEKPEEYVSFARTFDSDSVIFTQCDTAMLWAAYGWDGTNDITKNYKWAYPTTPSTNTALEKVLIDGVEFSDYVASLMDYDIPSDTTIVLVPKAANCRQKLHTTCATEDGNLVFTTEVTAESGDTAAYYTFKILHPKDSIGTLAGIYMDGVLLSNFHPDTLMYDITLPTPAIKVAQPQMPSITYVAGNKAQTIEYTPGELNGSAAEIRVTSENGNLTNTYYVSVAAQKSACVDLTGITVNGKMVDQFEPGRHYYSVSLATNTINVDYLSDDRFQTVTTSVETVTTDHQYRYTLNVKAENGDEANYEVMIYVENLSNDAQLANITLDGKNIEDFERLLNEGKKFDPGQNYYEINLPSGTTVWPEVSAQLKMAGQSVEISHHNDSIVLDVKAVDGTPNKYVLRFLVPKSKNANLSMIFLNGDSLQGFAPEDYVYQVTLPVGIHTLPEVAAQKGDAGQQLDEVIMDAEKNQATINVRAEESSYSRTYVVVFQFTQSDADTLKMIYEDGQSMPDFKPLEKYYQLSLPVGTAAFPDLSWEEGDEWQTIKMDTVESTANTLVRQITVTSESRRTRTYTVSYAIEKSDVDTLQMIFIDHKQLNAFAGSTITYMDTLTAAYANELNGQLPLVEYTVGDEYQTVTVFQQPEDELSNKSLDYKSIITVKAATGTTRTYTIHYPVELSTDATLNMINVSGKPISNYDSERFNYRLEIEKEAAVPVVSVIKKEEAQIYEIRVLGDTVEIVVWAESLKDSVTYSLYFERLKSAQTTLRDIILKDQSGEQLPSSEFPYRPEVYSYIVNIPYAANKPLAELLPSITPEFYDEEQTADIQNHDLPNGDIQSDVIVTAPNGEDQAIYSITFHLLRPTDATLVSISFNGEEFADFRPSKTEYIYAHPYGTDPADYFTQDAIAYILSDSLATDTIYTDEQGLINIVVTAQDGRTSMTYLISQTTAKDGDNALAFIKVNGDTIKGFDPETTFYTYYVFSTDVPTLDVEARSENASVDKGRIKAGDTCTIVCTAADGAERNYYVHFALTTVDPGVKATKSDVLLKRVPGSRQYVAYAVRQGVSFALFDQNGHLLLMERVPVANPNDAEVMTDSEKKEFLNDVTNTGSGLLIDVLPGQPYFYTFFYEEKEKLDSGKIMCY